MFVYFLSSVFSKAYIGTPAIFDLASRDDPLCPESCKGQLKRTLFEIIWSCVSTITLCAWTAVHPNVPPRSKWQARWSRLQLMFWMIVAPELVLAWAVRQLFAARDIRDAYNNSRQGMPSWNKWTLVEGHLLGMGGFTLVDPDLKRANPKDKIGQVLTYAQFEEVIRDPRFEFPELTEADIQDRSKGDVLFKVIAILQTTWFIIQCVARGQQRLGLTELELVTLALASLNAVTFWIWWYKPLGVQEPVRIYLRIQTPTSQEAERASVVEPRTEQHLSFRGVISKGWENVKWVGLVTLSMLLNPCKFGPIIAFGNLFIAIPINVSYIITFPFFVLFPLGIILLLKIIKTEPATQHPTQVRGLFAARIVASIQSIRYSLSSAVAGVVERTLNKVIREVDKNLLSASDDVGNMFGWSTLLPLLFILELLFVIFFIPFLTLLFLISFIFTSVFGIVTTSTIRPGASHVPSFYASITKSDRWSRMVVFALFGAIFGSIHCIGWYFDYPAIAERNLWRATSLTITVIPLIVAPIDFLLATRLRNHDINSCKRLERIVLLILDLIMTILLFIYVSVRLSLIVQALVLLRNQPPNALVAIDWTKYIPHLFSQ